MAASPPIRALASSTSLVLVGVIGGASLHLYMLSGRDDVALSLAELVVRLAVAAAIYTLALVGVRAALRFAVARASFSEEVKARYPAYDGLTYWLAAMPVVSAVGIRIVPLLTFLTVLLFLIAQGVLLYALMSGAGRGRFLVSFEWLSLLFLISGLAALVYQVCWQRALFAAFGVNIASVTLVVSAFMLGLGAGSFVGGWISQRFPRRLPHVFLVCELTIGAFGLLSLALIELVARVTLHGSPFTVAAAVFSLLVVPTMAMGATLPVLVTHLNRHLDNVGASVGQLYFVNTLGAAFACFITADILFVLVGLHASVYVAAALNLVVGVLVFRYAKRTEAVEPPGVRP